MSNLEVDPDLAKQILEGAAAAGEPVEAYLNRIASGSPDVKGQARFTTGEEATSKFRDLSTKEVAASDPRQRFQRLASKWRDETSHLSSYTDRVLHPAYQEIIGMGDVAVPLLLQDLREQGGHGFGR